MNTLKKLWRGVYPLGTAFWGFYVFGVFVCFILAGLLVFSFRSFHAQNVGLLLGLLLAWTYWVVASVGVWQSAAAGIVSPVWMDRIWPILARGVILLTAGRIIFNLINGGALTLMALFTGRLDF